MNLRSALVAATMLGIGVSNVSAQQRTTLGVRGGVSVASASLDIDETFSQDNRTGFAGGVFLDFDGGIFGLQVAGQYTQKGAELDVSNTVSDLSLAYLEIPGVLKLGIPLGSVKPSVFGGVALSFITTCDNDGEDCKESVTSTDFLGIAGADLAIYLGAVSLWADGRYHFGLSNVSDAGDIVDDLKNRNWTFQAGLGFRI